MVFDWRRFVFAFLVLLIFSLSAFLGSHYISAPPGECPPCLSQPSPLRSPQPPHDRLALVPHEIAAESCSQSPACQHKWEELNGKGLWRAQGGQDKWNYEHIFWKKSEPGIFVEFGARNGETGSNSYFFEHALGWSGLLAEIAANEIAGIKERRKGSLVLHGGICDKRGMVDFKINDQVAGLSGQVEHDTNRFPHYSKTVTKVPCYTLNEVLNMTGFTKIDYMTVDTEGSEFSILNALDFSRFVITVIQVETINSEVERRRAIDALLLSKGYKIIHTVDLGLDTLDVIYFRTPQADLLNFNKLLQDGWPASFLQS